MPKGGVPLPANDPNSSDDYIELESSYGPAKTSATKFAEVMSNDDYPEAMTDVNVARVRTQMENIETCARTSPLVFR